MIRRKWKTILPACICAFALLLAGCGGNVSVSSGTADAASAAEESTAESAENAAEAETEEKETADTVKEAKETAGTLKTAESSEKKEDSGVKPASGTDAADTAGTSADGAAADGTAADGTNTDGTAADGTNADGTAADGTAADRTNADGTSADGTASDGTGTDGTAAEGDGTGMETDPAQAEGSEMTGQPAEEPVPEAPGDIPLPTEETVLLDPSWEFADSSAINSGAATLFYAQGERKGIVVGVNAGHGTQGGSSVYTYCHPDRTPKVTGGTTGEGAIEAMAVSTGMEFYDGTPERDVTLREAQILKDLLLANGYDVLMLRNSDDVQLDNVARTVICNNRANCHIAIHWDGDGLDYDKGCYYMAVPDGIKGMYPTSTIWEEDNRLGECLIAGLSGAGCPIMTGGSIQMDLTQTSYSSVPSVDIELGNKASDHSEEALAQRAQGLLAGINMFFGY